MHFKGLAQLEAGGQHGLALSGAAQRGLAANHTACTMQPAHLGRQVDRFIQFSQCASPIVSQPSSLKESRSPREEETPTC